MREERHLHRCLKHKTRFRCFGGWCNGQSWKLTCRVCEVIAERARRQARLKAPRPRTYEAFYETRYKRGIAASRDYRASVPG